MEHDSPNTLAQKIHLRYHKINIKEKGHAEQGPKNYKVACSI